MRKLALFLFIALFLAQAYGQQTTGNGETKVSGCVTSFNGAFKLLTPGQTYTLKGHSNELFGYIGKLMEVTGTVDASQHHAPGYPITLHVTKLKKLADSCH